MSYEAIAAELKNEKRKSAKLEAAKRDYLVRIAALNVQIFDLEKELQFNVARHREKLSAHEINATAKPTHTDAVAEQHSTLAMEGTLPAFSRMGKIDNIVLVEYTEAARNAFRSRDWTGAIATYEKLLSYYPRKAIHWKMYGHALKEDSQKNLAIQAYFKALELDPTSSDTALHLGHLLVKQGQTKAAFTILHTALLADFDNAALKNELGDLGEAIPAQLPPKPKPFKVLKGYAKWRHLQTIKRAQKHFAHKQWVEAEAIFTAEGRRLNDHKLLVQSGHCLKERGKVAEAEAMYRAALELAPLSSDAWLHVGHVLKDQGQTSQSREAYLKALALNPANSDAANELSHL